LFVLIALAAAAGCGSKTGGGSETPAAVNELREVESILRSFPPARKGPSKLADLAPFEQTQSVGYQAVKSGSVVIVWGATMPGEGSLSGSEAIVAYEQKAPTEGGYVLLQNGTIKQLTAAEFASAPKAK